MTAHTHPDPIRIPFDRHLGEHIEITDSMAARIVHRGAAILKNLGCSEHRGDPRRDCLPCCQAAGAAMADAHQAPASGGDEAVVEAILAVCRSLTVTYEDPDLAAAILAAIRSGAIPLPEDVPQIAALRAELNFAKSDPAFSTRMHLANVLGMEEPGVPNASELIDAATKLRADRDALAKRLAEAENEAAQFRKLVHEYGDAVTGYRKATGAPPSVPLLDAIKGLRESSLAAARDIARERQRTTEAREERDRLAAQVAELNALYIQSREGRATHRCKVCHAKWIQLENNGGWTLASKACGKCCDNVAMGDQIEAIGLTAQMEGLTRERDAHAADKVAIRDVLIGHGHGAHIGTAIKEAVAEVCQRLTSAEDQRDRALADLAAAKRWETGVRNMVTFLIGPDQPFDIDQIVEMVRRVAKCDDNGDPINGSDRAFVPVSRLAAERAAREMAERERDAVKTTDEMYTAISEEAQHLRVKLEHEGVMRIELDAAQAKLAKAVESLRWARQRIRPSIDGPRDFAYEDQLASLDALLVKIGGGT